MKEKKNKIGIITFHNAHNYGACLQAYALQEYLKEIADEVNIIDYDSPVTKHYNLILPVLRKNIFKSVQQLIDNIRYYKKRRKRWDHFQAFIHRYLNLSAMHYKNERQLKNNYPRYDYYICGSDQIWNIDLVGNLTDAFTLNFGDDSIKRISYAASIGKDQINKKEAALFQRKLKRLDKVSVREPEAQKLLNGLIEKEVTQVCDPVFLRERKDWERFAMDAPSVKQPYILVYSVIKNDTLVQIVNEISSQTGYPVISFEEMGFHNVLKFVNDASPVEFVNLIKNAEIVVANSFHALAFSLIFDRTFWIIPHKKTNSRIDNLLNLTNNQDRLLCSVEEIKNCDFKEKPQGLFVDSKLQDNIEASKMFLKEAICSNRN